MVFLLLPGVGRGLVDEVHELIEAGSDYDLRASVELSTGGGVVGGDGVVFATATGSEAGGVDTEVVLEHLHYA